MAKVKKENYFFRRYNILFWIKLKEKREKGDN